MHQNFQLCNPMELCENELAALKTYFQRCGLQLPNENLVVVIKNRQDATADRDRQFSEIKKNKEKWQNIYERYREKYPQSVNEFSTPGAHSTPNIPTIAESLVTKMNEKSSQTSLVRNSAKGTQVEANKSSKVCQVTQTTDQGTMNSKNSHEFTDVYQNQSEVAESFEFIAGSLKIQQDRKVSSPESSRNSEISKRSEQNCSEPSIKNDDISNFDDSLKVAIALLNSLLESRHMKPELKRNLAGKVIQKIVQIQTSRSIQTSTLSSGIYPISNSSAVPSESVKSVKEVEVKEKDSKKSSSRSQSSSGKSREDVLKDCFKPMTLSEVNFQHSLDEEPTKGSNRDQPQSQLMDYVKREKRSQLKRIEMEIEHLKNLRDLLKRNDTPISIDAGQPIYENLSLLLKKPKEDPKSEEEKLKASDKASRDVPQPDEPRQKTNVWDSHANKKSAKSRSKLETPDVPSHAESLASFIDNKNRKFIERYEKHNKRQEDAHLYTRPYSEKRKSSNTHVIRPKHGSRKTQMTATKDVQTSTSLASSSVFESSDSISVPVNTNSKTSTTHQSETFHKNSGGGKVKSRIAETQTTDSICRTKPVFENANYGTTSTTVTQRVNRIKNDKQQQTNAPSVRYTLTFDKSSRANIRSYMSLPQRGNSDYAISKSSKEIYNQISSSATLDNRNAEDKENYNSDEILEEGDELDLQSCLNQNRPDIFTRFEERKRCIAELKKLR